MKKRIRTIAMVAVLAGAGAGAAVFATTSAHADTRLCEQYGSVSVGNYVVQNNRWGTNATQCINVTEQRLPIIQQDGAGNTSGAPTRTRRSSSAATTATAARAPLPAQISAIASANSSISLRYPAAAPGTRRTTSG